MFEVHCWDYRRIIVARSKTTLENELNFSTSKITRNFSNYSSWHYRSELLPRIYPSTDGPTLLDQQKLAEGILLLIKSVRVFQTQSTFLGDDEECNLVQNAVFTDPNDQSAWFYQRWLLFSGEEKQSTPSSSLMSTLKNELESCQQLYDLEPNNKCRLLLLIEANAVPTLLHAALYRGDTTNL